MIISIRRPTSRCILRLKESTRTSKTSIKPKKKKLERQNRGTTVIKKALSGKRAFCLLSVDERQLSDMRHCSEIERQERHNKGDNNEYLRQNLTLDHVFYPSLRPYY